jgi:hypothetical protein
MSLVWLLWSARGVLIPLSRTERARGGGQRLQEWCKAVELSPCRVRLGRGEPRVTGHEVPRRTDTARPSRSGRKLVASR